MKLLDEYERFLQVRKGRMPGTARMYRAAVRRAADAIGQALGRAPTLADLSAERVQDYLDGLRVDPSTKQYQLGALRAFFRFVALKKLGPDISPELMAPKRRRTRLPPVLDLAEVDRLMEAPLRYRPPERLTALDLRDAAILELLFGAGLRNSELAQLDVARLRFRTDKSGPSYLSTRVNGKGDKERMIIIEEGKSLEALRRYLARRGELPGAEKEAALFLNWYGARITRRGVLYVVRRWARRAGMECWPHLLRHTYATHMVAAAGEKLRGVQELMGHDDPATTARYAQIDEARLRKTARLHPRANRAATLAEVGQHAAELGRAAGRLAGETAGKVLKRLRPRKRAPAA